VCSSRSGFQGKVALGQTSSECDSPGSGLPPHSPHVQSRLVLLHAGASVDDPSCCFPVLWVAGSDGTCRGRWVGEAAWKESAARGEQDKGQREGSITLGSRGALATGRGDERSWCVKEECGRGERDGGMPEFGDSVAAFSSAVTAVSLVRTFLSVFQEAQ
jgi:hypothetical protein